MTGWPADPVPTLREKNGRASAVRLVDYLEFAELEPLPPDRILPVREEPPYATEADYLEAAVALCWRRARELGMSEALFRRTLRTDPELKELAPWAEVDPLPEYEPRQWLSPEEAEFLVDHGLAEPVETG